MNWFVMNRNQRRCVLLVIVVAALVLCYALLHVSWQLLSTPPAKFIQGGKKKVDPVTDQLKFSRTNVSHLALSQHSPSANLDNLHHAVTVVTAYFNLGRFRKGDDQTFTPGLYRKWMTVFSKIRNPVVAYFDSDDDIEYFRVVRSSLSPDMTNIVKITRSELWAFGLENFIKKIFAQYWYPKHYPNTVVAAYSCAMHAKYELMRRTVEENPFHTLYISWLDIGLFRSFIGDSSNLVMLRTPEFHITLPPRFNFSAIAYGEVYQIPEIPLSVNQLINFNFVWVCGCFFIGRVDVMFRWSNEYMNGVENMLSLNRMSTDQQVLYWMRSTGQITVPLQLYNGETRDDYFYLGYLCRQTIDDDDT